MPIMCLCLHAFVSPKEVQRGQGVVWNWDHGEFENIFPALCFLGFWNLREMSMSCGRSDARCVMVRNAHCLLQGSGPMGAPVQGSNHVSVVGVKFTALSAWRHVPLMRSHFNYILSPFRRVLNRICNLTWLLLLLPLPFLSFLTPLPPNPNSGLTLSFHPDSYFHLKFHPPEGFPARFH
jgi:hypothetical protein